MSTGIVRIAAPWVIASAACIALASRASAQATIDQARVVDAQPAWVNHEYGTSDSNRCLEDASSFLGDELGLVASYKRVEVKGKDCMSLPVAQPARHVEGVVRIPYPGRELLLFSYQNGGLGTDASALVRVDVRDSEHLTDDEFLLEQTEGRDAELRWCKTVSSGVHIGGMQALGDYVFAGVEQSGAVARVDIYRVKDGDTLRAKGDISVTSVAMPSGSKAHYVMATRLADGTYFMAVNRANAGDFSLFSAPSPTGPWDFVGNQSFPALSDAGSWPSDGERIQSANFVTDCAGGLYVVALGQGSGANAWFGSNHATLYAVDLAHDADGKPSIVSLTERASFSKKHGLNHCEMRGAGGVHVTPSGRLALYCGPNREFELMGHDFEFSSIRPPE